MRDNYFICLGDSDLGQLLDGIDARQQAWRDTSTFLTTGKPPTELFVAEECSDAKEARKIAAHYKRIAATIRRQRKVQDGYAKRDEKLPPVAEDGSRPMFCIYVDTLAQGPVPVERDEKGNPFVYPTRCAAEREIADITIERLHQFLAGERDFDDAIGVEDFIIEVDLMPDGSIRDEDGRHFSRGSW